MVRNGAPISEEVGQARIDAIRRSEARSEAIRRMGEAYGRAAAEVAAGLTRVGEAARAAGQAMGSLRKAEETAGRPVPHAFTPDLDLRCAVRGCELGPEEHER